jgi:LacI family transcriptional regulator
MTADATGEQGTAAVSSEEAPARRPLLADVAERAGVSLGTASRALNGRGELSEETRRSVQQVADELGFRPSPVARSLRSGRSLTIGLVVPHLSHAFYSGVTEGAQATLEENGYRLILVDSGEEPERVDRALRTLVDQEVDGLLLSTAPAGVEHAKETMAGTTCVCIDELLPGLGIADVVLENNRGMGLLVEHMAGHGHTSIGCLAGPHDRSSARERREGFHEAMAARGLSVVPELVRDGDWTIASGYRGATELFALERPPTAIVTASAELALGALAAARAAGLSIPGDFALASFDDVYFAPLLEPPMTTVAYDTSAIGSEAARLLLAAIDADEPAWSECRIDVQLVVRRSCGCDYDAASMLDGALA